MQVSHKSHTSLTLAPYFSVFLEKRVFASREREGGQLKSHTPAPFFALFVEGGQLKSHTPIPLFCTLCFLPLFTTPAFFDLPLNVLFSDGGLNSPA